MKNSIKIPALIFVLVFSYASLSGQDNDLFLILQKGKATLLSDQNRILREFKPGKRETLSLNATLMLYPNSSAIVYNRNGSAEVGSVKEEKYTMNELSKTLNQKSSTTAFMRFYEFLNHTYAEMKQTETLKGSVTAAASRGGNFINFYYLPPDSSLIISDTAELSWGSKSFYKLMTKIVVVKSTGGDTVYNAEPVGSSITLGNLKEGEYYWTGMFKLGDGVTGKMNNVFIVPEKSMKSMLSHDLSQFREVISSFSDETKAILLKEYLDQKRICCIHQ
ncbi:MAG: hypothetical protein NTW10_07815 [Bacteroidetes bacterium]|nr:hypothetical protein [Bacteroidota bacterium]